MAEKKRDTVLGHNFIMIRNKKFMFHENNLIILDEANSEKKIYLLKLFSEFVEQTKLVKYHFSNNYAIFFFHFRTFYDENVGV